MSLNLFFFFKSALVILTLLLFHINVGICHYLQKKKKKPAGIVKLCMLKFPTSLHHSKQLHQTSKTAVL